MTGEEFAELLSLGHEVRGIEFKPPGPRSSRPLFLQVVKAMLGMSNVRNGGRVVIGVEEVEARLTPVGLSSSDLLTWSYDHISDSVSQYADPSISFHMEEAEYRDRTFVVILVNEFEEVPILCSKDETISGRTFLRKGACYVRSKRKPETTEIPTQEDMRALLELATAKAVKRWVTVARSAGVYLPSGPSPDDQEKFDEQLEDLR